MRWEVIPPFYEVTNRMSEVSLAVQNPEAGRPGALIFPSRVNDTYWRQILPRVGIVWDPAGDGRTSVRAAAGMFYGSISGNEWNTMTNFQPWSTRLTFTNTNPRTSAITRATRATVNVQPQACSSHCR